MTSFEIEGVGERELGEIAEVIYKARNEEPAGGARSGRPARARPLAGDGRIYRTSVPCGSARAIRESHTCDGFGFNYDCCGEAGAGGERGSSATTTKPPRAPAGRTTPTSFATRSSTKGQGAATGSSS